MIFLLFLLDDDSLLPDLSVDCPSPRGDTEFKVIDSFFLPLSPKFGYDFFLPLGPNAATLDTAFCELSEYSSN